MSDRDGVDRARERTPLTITAERLPNARVSLEITVDAETVERHMERAVSRVSRQVRVPGFRPGHVPRKMLERHIGTAALLQEALQELLPEVYSHAIEEQQVDAIDQPEFDLKSTEPLVVTAVVPVRPEVDLGSYTSLRASMREVTVDPEQVEQTLLNLRRQYAVLEPVERPVDWDDHIRADVSVSVEGQREPHEETDAEFPVRKNSVVSLPGFVERLVGLSAGGPHTVEFNLPDDFSAEELRGKKATYQVTIHEVKREVLPELDDEFAKSLGDEEIGTVAALRERVEGDLRKNLEHNAREEYHNEIIDLLVATATIDYPEVLVRREIDRLIDRESNHASHSEEGLRNWLNAIGSTEEEVREAFGEQADLNVRRGLVLGQLVDQESIAPTDEQVDAEIDSLVVGMTGSTPENQAAIRNLFDTPDGRVSIRNQLQTRLAVERLEAICTQPEEASAKPQRQSRRRRAGAEANASHADEAETVGEGTTDAPADSND
ncbi:MAG: trigger factor [Chloroflexi bacterium]|nr:trigger factor [Chloroflexota bacterium]